MLTEITTGEPRRFKLSTSAQMIWAMVIGIAVGLFFGEMVGWIGVIGNAVILLMQMTVLPYIVVSLIGGIGKLNADNAGALFMRAGIVMLALWGLGLAVAFLMPLTFPVVESASFFSVSSIAPPPAVDYFKLYIPANPFESLAAGAVPAVVLFSIVLGLALIGIGDKDPFLDVIDVLGKGLSRVTQGLLRILPVGIFAMSASAAGTLGVKELASLQVYFVVTIVFCGLLSYWIMPWVVGALTPVRYRDLVRISRTAAVTAFTTGNVFITLPVIEAECKKILEDKDALGKDGANIINILVPIAYAFPKVGKISAIVFVLFAGWFSGQPVDISSYPSLAVSGLLSLFGSVYVAIPFMLDFVRLPADLFQLFVLSGFLAGKFVSVTSVMYMFTVTLLSVAAFKKLINLRARHLMGLAAGLAGVTVAAVIVTRAGTDLFIDNEPRTSEIIANMKVAEAVPGSVSRRFPVAGETPTRPLANLDAIKTRGVLRVGYRPSNVPFSYYNNAADLVGFDVEMATKLGADVGVKVEFIPFKRDGIAAGLEKGYFDIVMSGLAMNVDLMQQVIFSTPVIELNRSLVMPDHQIKKYNTRQKILAANAFTVAYVEHRRLVDKARANFPNVEFKPIATYKEFFAQRPGTYDSLVISAEAGSAWSLFYPEYGVAFLLIDPSFPSGYALAKGNEELLRFVDNWLSLKRADGTVDRVYNYWILGQGAEQKSSRWSVIKDILHWVEH